MAQVGSITAESSSSEFLEQTKTEELANKFTSGKIATIADEFIKVIQEHKDTKGLSRRALSIEGRSPLNEIANEMIARLQVTVTDVEAAGKIATARGNNHTNQEAEKFLDEVLKKYEKLCQNAKSSLDAYKSASYTEKYTDSNGEQKTRTVECNSDITLNMSLNKNFISGANTAKLDMGGTKSSDSHFNNEYAKFEEDFKKAQEYYDGKVQEAIEFYNKNGKGALPTDGAKGLSLAMPNDETRPEGVQPDAKKTVDTDLGGRLQTITYTNPDGSTVKITKVEGKIKEHKVINRHGYTTETYKYDDDGNMTHKNVWEYKKVEGKDHVYESSYTRYEKNSSGEWEAVEEPKSYGYSYPVENDSGNVTIENQKGGDIPDDSKVSKKVPVISGTPGPSNEEKKSSDSSDTNKSGSSGSENSGTVVEVNKTSVDDTMNNKKDFVLPKGSSITGTNNGVKYTYGSTSENVYFEYDEDDKVYYIKNQKGDYVNSTNFKLRDKEAAKLQRAYIDPEKDDISSKIE